MKLTLLLAMTATLAVLVLLHVTGINGPEYWRWPWRRSMGALPYLVMLAMATPAFIAVWKPMPAVLALGLMMVSTLGLELANRAMDLEPYELTRVATIIEEPGSTGYFTHAQEFIASGKTVRDYLRDYVKLMPSLSLHARNKPPGSILFYVPFLRLTDSENNAALAAGLFIALLATLSVPATYWLVLELTGDRAAGRAAAMCMTLSPGLVLFLPEFDQVYPAISSLLVILWVRGLRSRKLGFGLAFGLLFALICFVTFNFLVLGVFILGYALVEKKGNPHPSPLPAYRERGKEALRQAAMVIAAFFGFYLLLWFWSGYNPLTTLTTGIANHQQDMPATHRTWPLTVPFDLLDFALGLGWVGALLAIYAAIGIVRASSKAGGWPSAGFPGTRDGFCSSRKLVMLCLAQPIAVALSGQLQGETARVWLFMAPITLIPAGLELSQWGKRSRIVAYACLCILTAILARNMVFV